MGRLRGAVLATPLLLLAAATTWAEPSGRVYVETFDGSDPAIMLNGVVDYGIKAPWVARIANEALELSNTDADNALRYYTLPTVSYRGTGTVSRTDGASIEVDVHVEAVDKARSGAGLVGGFDHRRKDYVLFAIGPAKQVYVVQRRNGKARMLATAEHDGIKEGGNRLRISSVDDGLGFDINGVRVMTVEHAELPGKGIGIGAFGRGTFRFDTVRIEAAEPLAMEDEGSSGDPD